MTCVLARATPPPARRRVPVPPRPQLRDTRELCRPARARRTAASVCGDKHVPVARRAKQIDKTAGLPLQPGGVLGRENSLEDHEGRAHPAQRDAKLVHAFRIATVQHRIVVRGRIGWRRCEKSCRGPHPRRCPPAEREGRRLVAGITLPAGEDVAALRLARRLYAERRRGLQREGELVESARRPLDQFELQLGDGIESVPRPDLPAIERELDQGRAMIGCCDLDHGGATHDVGGERGRQLRRLQWPYSVADRRVGYDGKARHRRPRPCATIRCA